MLMGDASCAVLLPLAAVLRVQKCEYTFLRFYSGQSFHIQFIVMVNVQLCVFLIIAHILTTLLSQFLMSYVVKLC